MPIKKSRYRRRLRKIHEEFSRAGQVVEQNTEEILRNAKDKDGNPVFCYVKRHPDYSKADMQGKDFTVAIARNGETIRRSFGMTISLRQFTRDLKIHGNVSQILLPLGTSPAETVAKVLALFN